MFPYKTLLSVLLAGLFLAPLYGQNVPDLSQTAPAGTPTNTLEGGRPSRNAAGGLNYVRTFVPSLPQTEAGLVDESSPAAQVRTGTVYKDGFLRPMLQVERNAFNEDGAVKHLAVPFDPTFKRDRFGYLPYTTTNQNFTAGNLNEQRSYYTSMYPDEWGKSFSAVQYRSTAAYRQSVSFAPGLSHVGQGRGTTVRAVTNGAGEVRIWTVSGGVPVGNSFYAAGKLKGRLVFNDHGARELTYSDHDGKVVYKKVYLTDNDYLTTYYVYDVLDRLRFVLPPKAMAAVPGGNVPVDVLHNLCFQYRFEDGRGRKTGEQLPGRDGLTEIVYDRKDRPVLRQTPNGAAEGVWEVTFYDARDRAKCTGLYTDGRTRAQWQYVMDEAGTTGTGPGDILYYLLAPEGEGRCPGEDDIPGNTMMGYNWYDGYADADPTGAEWATYVPVLGFSPDLLASPGAEVPGRGGDANGRATGGRARVLPGDGADAALVGEWKSSVVFYDPKGRPFYAVSHTEAGGGRVHSFYNGTQYDFLDRPVLSKQVMENTNAVGGPSAHKELTRTLYDGTNGKPRRLRHLVDDNTWQDLAFYKYDGMGRMRKNILGNYGEVQDMGYDIRGQLTGINAVYAETGDKQGEGRSFGASLKYDHGFTDLRYDGRIAGMVWRGSGIRANAYGYKYDRSGRMTSADYRRTDPTAVPLDWSNALADYSVRKLEYDADGNILSLDQMGMGDNGPELIDILSYTYDTLSNRLLDVTDEQQTDYGRGDFQDGNVQGSGTEDYRYDGNGNLTADANKGIDDVRYNHMDKPVLVSFGNGASIAYSYDASGNKVQELSTDRDGGIVTRDYVGNYVYEDNKLRYATTGTGRTVFDDDGLAPGEEFFVKDHLGNVRSIIDVKTYLPVEYLATFEIASANAEGLLFDLVNEIRDANPEAVPSDMYSGRLNGADADRRIGTALLVHVMAGDRVDMNVNSYYSGYDPDADDPVKAEDLLATLVTTLTGGVGGLPGEANDPQLVGQLFAPGSFSDMGAILAGSADPARPRAFLNYVLFDEDMLLVKEGTGSFQADGDGAWSTIGTTVPLTVPQNGYLSVFLSNSTSIAAESGGCYNCGDVYFDRLSVRYTKGVLREEEHYYPFGLPIAGMGSGTAERPNRDKYQGNEYNTGLGLNWMDFHNRRYDPQLGRFLGVDPLAAATESFSPYAAMNNNPASVVDPLGLRGYENIGTPQHVMVGTGMASSYHNPGSPWGTTSQQRGAMFFEESLSIADSWRLFAEESRLSGSPIGSGVAWGFTGMDGGNDYNPIDGGGGGGSESSDYTLWEYEQFTKGGKNGLSLRLSHNEMGEYEAYDWIQNVTTSQPRFGEKAGVPYADYDVTDIENNNPPFYYGKSGFSRKIANDGDYTYNGKYFGDQPARSASVKNFYWMAELSLVGKQKGVWKPITTFSYGYQVNNGTVTLTPFQTGQPSSFQINLIKLANKRK